MLRRPQRFAELVAHQLDLFAEDEADLLAEAEEAADSWRAAGRERAEEAYGDYQLVVDAIADALLDLRETYAATLAPDAVAEYRASFSRAAARRFRHHASIAADLDDSA